MADLRPDRKANRQAEISARQHANDTAPSRKTKAEKRTEADAMDRALSDVAKSAADRRAYRGAKLDARAQIRTATAIAGTLIMRLDAAYDAYAEACLKLDEARTKPQKRAAAEVCERRRVQLAELRRTINVIGPLNGTLLKAGKVVHDADLDRLLKQVQITGTEHFDRLCEGDA